MTKDIVTTRPVSISTNTDSSQGVHRTYKDSLFRKIFSDKEKLLSLYNAINGSSYTDASDLEINTLDNAVYLNMKNDVSFILDFQLNLYEHQSTHCGNMPLRNLNYVTKLYQQIIGDQSIYTSTTIHLPTPCFVVFYNGLNRKPEYWIERLSDAFEKPTDSIKLELEVLFLNVNYGKNKEIMEQCQDLLEYALYVEKVRTYAAVMTIEKAVDLAVTDCIKENILADYLSRYRAEAIQMSILEYDEERDMKWIRKAEYDVGKAETLISIVRKKLRKGFSVESIADFLEIDAYVVMEIETLNQQYPDADDSAIHKLLQLPLRP
ncbi:hypothetical protein LJC58_06515 [Lachnospiraceae bacterium OttesenSCG-928-D06]|nr:hypothetical protein [Lachnospiraceae bacterium OttesenSCG-928-D06]